MSIRRCRPTGESAVRRALSIARWVGQQYPKSWMTAHPSVSFSMLGWPGMELFVSLVRDYMHAEADAGYPLLRQIPSTRSTVCFDYLESISPAEREELLDARARITALGFVLTPAAQQEILQLVASNPAMIKYRDAMLRGPLAMGLRYQSIRMAKAVLSDAQSVAMMR